MTVQYNYFYHREARSRDEQIDALVEIIRSCRYANAVSDMRERVLHAVSNRTTSRVQSEYSIPYVTWAMCSEGYTGLVVITLPFDENTALLHQLRETVNALQQVICSYVSISGRSLKVIMPYTVLAADLSALDTRDSVRAFHSAAHANAAAFLLQVTGVKASGADADPQKGTLISADSNIYYNPQAIPVPIRIPEKMTTGIDSLDVPTYSKTLLPDYNTLQMQVLQFNMMCRRLDISSDGSIDENVLTLANECCKAGIPEEVGVKCTLAMSDQWRSHETLVRTSFENVYSVGKQRRTKTLSTTIFNQMLLRDFLRKCYFFRRNVITGSCEYMERNKYVSDWKPLNDIALNTICLTAHAAGIEAWDKDVKRYVGSDFINEYDPIAEWLYALPVWDGEDRVGEVARMVTTDTPHWEDSFRVWMRSMVSQWMNRGGLYGSSLVLMLIGGQGTGKSTFCKRLLPESLTPYYNDRLDFSNAKEADRSLMRFLLICLDEYDQISRSHGPVLKNILQKSDVKFRRMYQDEIEQRRRYATFCATTNILTPLTDPTGSRRYLCVNVTDKIDTSSAIDYEQLYAQVVFEIRKGQPCYLDTDEETRMQEYNQAFYLERPLEMIINQYVHVPKIGDKTVGYTSLELLQMIKTQLPSLTIDKPTTQQTGVYLVQQGFPRRRLARGWVYTVAKNVPHSPND